MIHIVYQKWLNAQLKGIFMSFATCIAFFLLFLTVHADAMDFGPPALKSSKEASFESVSNDSSGACCFCCLMTCSCVTGIGTIASLSPSVPIATTLAWSCCFCTSVYVLKEITEAYINDKKNT